MNLNDDDDDNDDISEIKLRFFDITEEPRRMLPPIQGFEKMPIVSLEEAVKPLVECVHNIKENALKAKAKCGLSPADGLSIDESASIRLYTMIWTPKDQCLYVVLNKTLRSENRDLLKVWFLYLKLLISSLLKLPSISRHLFRGVKFDFSQEYPKGEKPVWWGFSSCTDSVEVLKSNSFLGKTGTRTLFEIDCYSSRDIRRHSCFSTENELLLLPATQFEIVASLDVGNDLHIIQLKEIEPEFPLIEKGPLANQMKPVPLPVKALPLKVGLPHVTSPTFTTDPISRNFELQRDIARFPPHSNVNLDHQQLTDQDMKVVVERVIIKERCRKLSIRNSNITSKGITTLSLGVSESTTLEELDLSNNHLSDNDLIPLARELSVNRTTTVEQWKCCGIARVKELDKAPIKILNLSHNNIGDEGASYLAEVLKVKLMLIQLHLNDNQISDRGIQLLAKALCDPKTSLTKLYLNNNQLISDLSVEYLADMLRQNRSLDTLWLTDCNLTTVSKQSLTAVAASKKKFHLIV